jgi:hypothetical protein
MSSLTAGAGSPLFAPLRGAVPLALVSVAAFFSTGFALAARELAARAILRDKRQVGKKSG